MDSWKIQLVVVIICALAQTYQALASAVVEESVLPLDWQEEALGLTHPMVSLMKRSKALRFYGLMGKRSGTGNKKPFQVNRRNKGEMFVGLMGRSLSSDEHLTRIVPSATTAIDVSDKPHKQDSSEQWVQILY